MLTGCRRRFRLQSSTRFLTTLTILAIFAYLFRTDPGVVTSGRANREPRLFCIMVLTHITHIRIVQHNNISWARHCHTMGIVKIRPFRGLNDNPYIHGSPYHAVLWTRILTALRQSINSFESISSDDLLVIVPAATFVFREKLSALVRSSATANRQPFILIHTQDEGNAYILNGLALDRVRNTKLVDVCLQRSYISARETHLWTCIKYSLRREHPDVPCEDNSCFVRYHQPELTLAQIKAGFCLGESLPACQAMALLYPTTLNDLITLEFFKYRLKPDL